MKPIIFYRVSARGAMYRFFFEDRYVAFSTLTSLVTSVEFGRAHREQDRAHALNMFREDPCTWTEL